MEYHLNYAIQAPNRTFKLHLLFANETISDIFYFKHLEQLIATSNGKLKITYILARPPSNWEELSGHINEDILYKWLTQNYASTITDISFPPISTSSDQEQFKASSTLLPLEILTFKNNNYLNGEERVNDAMGYMQALIQDPKHIKLVVCGPPLMIDSVEDSLDNIGFPDDKAIFIR